MFGWLSKKRTSSSTMDALVRTIYGDRPPEKTADVRQAAALAADVLLGGIFDRLAVVRIANELNAGPMPYSTHDLAVSTALNQFKSPPSELRAQLFEIQLTARMTVLSWVKDGKVVPALAQVFEHALYEAYKPSPTGSEAEPAPRQVSPESGDNLLEELAEVLAQNATTFPPDEVLGDYLAETGHGHIPGSRFRFGLSIANEVINIVLINELFPTTTHLERLVDALHEAFYARHPKTNIGVGELIVATDEIEYVRNYMEAATNSSFPDVQSVGTTIWSMLDVVYLPRQEAYQKALEIGRLFAHLSQLPDGYTPMTYVALKLATHITGESKNSGGEAFVGFAAGLESFLATYKTRARETLSSVQ